MIARVSRSVQAVNEGFAPGASVSTGPHQPLSALRDAVAILGATTGRLESSLVGLAISSRTPAGRLVHAASLAELSKVDDSTSISVVGDSVALLVASDLADLGKNVVFYDSAATEGADPSDWLVRVAPQSAKQIPAGGILAVIACRSADDLGEELTAMVKGALKSNPAARLVTCLTSGSDGTAVAPYRGADKHQRVEVRALAPATYTSGRRATRVILSAQEG